MSIRFVAAGATTLAESIPDSLVSLMARIAAGGVFWRSGQTKIDGLHIKDSTFFLFREEYMVPLLPPDLAAYLATIAENVFSVLLIIGLASRLSAAALLGLTAVIQLFVYPSAWPEHILWATALLVVIARGPASSRWIIFCSGGPRSRPMLGRKTRPRHRETHSAVSIHGRVLVGA